MPDITIYTQPYCPYCSQALRLLRAKGVAFSEVDAPHGSPQRAEATRLSGGRTTMPQIFAGERHIGGCDDLLALDRTGGLDTLLAA